MRLVDKKVLIKSLSICLSMENQRKHLRHIMLHSLHMTCNVTFLFPLKNNSANNTANKICMVYGNGATSVQTVCS